MVKYLKTTDDGSLDGRSGATGVNAVNPLLIALIFVLAMALPAVLVVKYAVRPRREPALANSPARRRHSHSEEGSVIVPVRASETAPASPKSGLLKLAKLNKEQQASAIEHQVDDTIRRLILMS